MTLRLTALALCCAAALSACSQQNHTSEAAASAVSAAVSASDTQAAAGNVAIETARGEATVPAKPERVAVYDWGMLDTLTKLGVPVGATTDVVRLDYLKDVAAKAAHVGTLFEPNYEALNAFQPQLIVTGSRTAPAFDQLGKLAPTIEMTADTTNMRASTEARIDAFAKIFGKETEAAALKKEIDDAFTAAKTAAAGKGNGLVIIVNGGKVSAFGPDSRFGWIHKEVGVPTVDPDIKEGSHGQPASFEYIKQRNPDWLFVLDRGAAIGQEGESAKDVLNNPLIAETTAWKKGQVVYLIPENYLAAGGAQQLLNATAQVREAFEAAK
ncbi:siderophore ABC transporter substrate-binding protein [Uruburuella testudinis]|uniref:Siderophore ABC transporter substrate-binding protein n=1 Tax=Uruburuella testudinis TaxID=1282863 RepID=A0ABY4DS37_9NEIS|nr:siderophore ABC transporter substrate-binding protein [Uruburuella testudinis]UOO81686.1 siderophore ABC transporter substrate-binding protein [Uruburuella testudinis]